MSTPVRNRSCGNVNVQRSAVHSWDVTDIVDNVAHLSLSWAGCTAFGQSRSLMWSGSEHCHVCLYFPETNVRSNPLPPQQWPILPPPKKPKHSEVFWREAPKNSHQAVIFILWTYAKWRRSLSETQNSSSGGEILASVSAKHYNTGWIYTPSCMSRITHVCATLPIEVSHFIHGWMDVPYLVYYIYSERCWRYLLNYYCRLSKIGQNHPTLKHPPCSSVLLRLLWLPCQAHWQPP